MTRIVYTITLKNDDGTQATASTPELEYVDIPSGRLQQAVNDNSAAAQRSNAAMLEMVRKQLADRS